MSSHLAEDTEEGLFPLLTQLSLSPVLGCQSSSNVQ